MSWLGLLSLMFGIFGMCLSCIVIGVIPCILSVILGCIALKDEMADKWPSILGMICSIIGMFMFVLVLTQSEGWDIRNLATPTEVVRNIAGTNKRNEAKNALAHESNSQASSERSIENNSNIDNNYAGNADSDKKSDNDNNGKKVYQKGETANCNGLELTFLGYTESSGTEYNSPSDGKIFVFPEFEVYNGTNEKVTMDTWTPFLYYCDGYSVESSSNAIFSMTELGLAVLTGDIVQGGRMRACLPLELPSDWKEMQIFYKDNYFGDAEFSFAFKK